MKIIVLGSVKFTSKIIDFLIKKKIFIDGVIGSKKSKYNSDHFDIVKFYKKKFDGLYTKDINDKKTYSWIKNKKPDLIFCLGWSKIIRPKILKIPKLGVIGYHPQDLPKNKGKHPIIWSLVLGLKNTASTFFFMNSKIDSGSIISKKNIKIKKYYYAKDLYKRLYLSAQKQIYKIIIDLKKGKIKNLKQNRSLENIWRKRNFEDGKIDWRMDAENILNLIKALSQPYPGAHFFYEKKRFKVWKAEIVNVKENNLEPGKIFKKNKLMPIIKCGNKALKLTQFSPKKNFLINSYL